MYKCAKQLHVWAAGATGTPLYTYKDRERQLTHALFHVLNKHNFDGGVQHYVRS